MTAKQRSILAALFSLFIPGAGQLFKHAYKRGAALFLLTASAVVTVLWYQHKEWWFAAILIWLWVVLDAYRYPRNTLTFLPILFWLILAYGIGWQVTEIDPTAIFRNQERASIILKPMLRPDFTRIRTETLTSYVEIQVPCSPTPPTAARTDEKGITVSVSPNCANLNDFVELKVTGMWPDFPVTMEWHSPIGAKSIHEDFRTDAAGNGTLNFQVKPIVNIAAPDQTLPQMHRIVVVQTKPLGGIILSETGGYILRGIYETLSVALLSTLIGALLAIPFSFLAARNLMSGNPYTRFIYLLVRTFLNIVRSVESLIMAIIFVVIVGLGTFPGMLAITLHTIAALGKLYSEVIEGIDPGPIEAMRATGANWLQVVRYGVIPQIVPPFMALTIYRWDINVRSSTIIGFVGGGGIGFYLYQWILLQDYRSVSASFISIAVVVMLLDFFSARLREQIR
jgi:phosphonate transport system permease protein